jgi:hypothetical protein
MRKRSNATSQYYISRKAHIALYRNKWLSKERQALHAHPRFQAFRNAIDIILRGCHRHIINTLPLEKRRPGSANIVGIDNISRAVLLKFGYTSCCISYNHQRQGSLILQTFSDCINWSYYWTSARICFLFLYQFLWAFSAITDVRVKSELDSENMPGRGMHPDS